MARLNTLLLNEDNPVAMAFESGIYFESFKNAFKEPFLHKADIIRCNFY
jgi:hypothetical protein